MFSGVDATPVDDVFAIVPVKPLAEGKSRLGAILSAGERAKLNGFLMDLTLERAAVFPGASRTIVVSRSREVLAAAESRGMIPLPEEAEDLNEALASASRKAMSLAAGGVLILPVDLPLAGIAAIKQHLAQCHPPVCIIAPDRRRSGTNLLYVSPIYDDLYRFGPDSFRKHQVEAARRDLQIVVLEDDALAIDIDDSADYRLWMARVDTDRSRT
jgi:2-phospho-L-lactate guanylyltransferase